MIAVSVGAHFKNKLETEHDRNDVLINSIFLFRKLIAKVSWYFMSKQRSEGHLLSHLFANYFEKPINIDPYVKFSFWVDPNSSNWTLSWRRPIINGLRAQINISSLSLSSL
jgi:hypothetical protein